jgi:phage tail sheath protein FI
LPTFEGTLANLTNAGTPAQGLTFSGSATNHITTSLSGGVDSGDLTTAEYLTGYALVNDVDTITVDFLIAPGMSSQSDQTSVVNNLVTIAGTTRKDCVVVTSPNRAAVVNSSTQVTSSVTTADTFTFSSYLVVDNNYLKVYDKYNDQYIQIPAASSTAGIMAASDAQQAPWFSPAGQRRGAYLGITSLSYSPTKAERDTLYKAGINPVANIPGQGVLLFGDKTHMSRPSAFDRINVRRLFLTVERAISIAARNVMFEFNDEFTRAEFQNIVEPFLREIQGRRGITDFRVVCDATNNTAAVVDRNEFIANVFIKPARSINYVTLNFVAVRTGVEFEEVVGTV